MNSESTQGFKVRSGSKVRVRVQGPVSFSASPRLTKMERVLLQNHPVNQPQPNVGGQGGDLDQSLCEGSSSNQAVRDSIPSVF